MGRRFRNGVHGVRQAIDPAGGLTDGRRETTEAIVLVTTEQRKSSAELVEG